MTMLYDIFTEKMKKNKDTANLNEMVFPVSYSTGILPLDRAISYVQDVHGELRYEIGLSDSSITTIIGDSGTGKTSLLVSASCNIIRRFRTSCVFFEQAEGGVTIQRIKNLTKFSDDDFNKRFIIRDAGITIESIYRRVKAVHDIKMANPDKYLYDTHMVDYRGKPILKHEPTIFIIDSMKMIMGEDKAKKDQATLMDGASGANLVSNYFIRMTPLLRESNIMMIIVNHITTDIPTGPFPKKAEFPFLKPGEHIPCGRLLRYISNVMLRLDIKSKLDPDEGYGITGTITNIDVIKSRTSSSGKAKCSLIYDHLIGYDPDLSAFQTFKENNLLQGAGAYLKLPGCDLKFSQRNFKNLLYSNPELAKAYVNLCSDYLKNDLLEEYKKIQAATTVSNLYESVLDNLGAIPDFNKNSDESNYVMPEDVEEEIEEE